MLERLRVKFVGIYNQLASSGFFHIIISSTLVKIVSFISAMFLPRIISDKADYGLLSYVDNIRSYILMINGLGISYAIMRYCAKESNEKRRWGYFVTIMRYGVFIDVFIVLGTVFFAFITPETIVGQRELIIYAAATPIFFLLFDGIQLYLRSCLKNKEYSALSFSYSIIMVLFQIAAALAYGVTGVVWIRYVAITLAALYGVYLIKKTRTYSVIYEKPSVDVFKEIKLFGFIMLLSNATSSIMALNETQLLASVTKDAAMVAEYKVATYIFFIATFLSQSITVFIFPYFVKNIENKNWIWKSYKKVMKYNALIMVILHIGLWILVEPFTYFVFGEQYAGSIPFMKLLLIASFGQTVFRSITGNVLAAVGGERFNLLINCISIVVHISVAWGAMKIVGVYGIVIGSIAVYYLSSIPMIIFLYRMCNKKIEK